MFSGSLLLTDVVVWWWLIVNVVCSRVVQCWYILPNMLVLEYCWILLVFFCILISLSADFFFGAWSSSPS